MNWEIFYLVCFVVGFTFSLVSFLGGMGRFHLHVPKHFHVGGHAGGAAGHAGTAGHAHGAKSGAKGVHFSVVNPATIAAFLTWFGGMGYLLVKVNHVVVLTGLALATLAGIAGGALIFWFVGKVLMNDDADTDPLEYEMVGVLGRVSSAIRAGGTGEIIFTQQGVRRVSAARNEGSEALSKGEEVVVMRHERGIAYVRRWEELAPSPASDAEQETKNL
ncbi:MAG TPA: hypothetical protein VKT33_12860 [Candidatus Angelobacter sp.]|nr:hypothetical protein [Candidatus Angelobacter sp.]